jgi:hypothetical protein
MRGDKHTPRSQLSTLKGLSSRIRTNKLKVVSLGRSFTSRFKQKLTFSFSRTYWSSKFYVAIQSHDVSNHTMHFQAILTWPDGPFDDNGKTRV